MAADDLTVSPDFTLPLTTAYKTLVSKFENGAEQRRAKWATPIRSWRLSFRNKSQTDKDTLQTLFASKLGRYGTFLWTNPLDSVQYTVRFDTDELQVSEKAYQIYDIEFDLIEVR
jgi:phage-related protein